MRSPATSMKPVFAPAFILAGISLVHPIQVHGEEWAVAVEPLASATAIGEPVVLWCEFTNEAETPAALDLGWNDIEKISFALDPGGKTPGALTQVQRGGGGDFGTKADKIAPHHRIHRYIVLNQWFRPSKAGAYPLEIVVKIGDRAITSRFQITVAAGDATAVQVRTEGLVKTYLEWRDNPGDPQIWERLNYWEKFNYKHCLLIAWTYVYQAFPEIGAAAKKRHGDNFVVKQLLEEASVIGPGGSRALD